MSEITGTNKDKVETLISRINEEVNTPADIDLLTAILDGLKTDREVRNRLLSSLQHLPKETFAARLLNEVAPQLAASILGLLLIAIAAAAVTGWPGGLLIAGIGLIAFHKSGASRVAAAMFLATTGYGVARFGGRILDGAILDRAHAAVLIALFLAWVALALGSLLALAKQEDDWR